MNRIDTSCRFPRKTMDKKPCRAISRNKASTSLVLWKLMAVVETILSLPRSRTHEHNAVKWFALEYQVSSVFRPDAGPALPRMRSLCRMDALVRLVQPFRFVKLPFLLSFLFFSFLSRELGQSWSKRAIERIAINWIQVFVTSALSTVAFAFLS